jgi:arylsulfate sulfotransferase
MVLVKGKAVGAPSPYLQEFKWGSTEPAVEIRINGSMGYQAMPFRVQKAFNHAK